MRAFFGLGNNDWTTTEEKIFLLMHYGKFSYNEARNLPMYKVIWHIKRINEELKKSDPNKDKELNEENLAKAKNLNKMKAYANEVLPKTDSSPKMSRFSR